MRSPRREALCLTALAALASHCARFNTRSWKRLRTTYVVLMTTTFATEILSILLATSASNRALGGGFNPMAESCIAMIAREFPEQIVALQFNFFTGMISFVVAQSIRFYRELSARPFTCHVSRAAAWTLAYVSLQMIAFFNDQLLYTSGYPELTATYVGNLLRGAASGFMALKPAPVLAFGCLGIAFFYVLLALLDADQDGELSTQDAKQLLREIQSTLSGKVFKPRTWGGKRE